MCKKKKKKKKKKKTAAVRIASGACSMLEC